MPVQHLIGPIRGTVIPDGDFIGKCGVVPEEEWKRVDAIMRDGEDDDSHGLVTVRSWKDTSDFPSSK
jgi:hypothetical protein